jgi:hypothetical protein
MKLIEVVHEKHQDDTYTCSMHPQIVQTKAIALFAE